MTFELGRALLISGAVSAESLAQALFAVVTKGMPLARALVTVGAIGERRLEEELAHVDVPTVRNVRPAVELMEKLPAGICLRLAVVPVRTDPVSGKVVVAALDARDPHPAEEIGYHLGAKVHTVRATLDTLRDALELYPGLRALAPPMGAPPSRHMSGHPASHRPHKPTPTWGTPLPDADGAEHLSEVPIPLSRRASEPRIRPSPDEAVTDPIFELRRSAPSAPGVPSTTRDPEPPPFNSDAPPAFPLRVPLPPKVPAAATAPMPPFADPAAFLEGIREAKSRDAVIGLVQMAVREVARKVGVLVVRKDGVTGWSCTPELGDEAAFKALRASLETPGPLATALAEGVHLGPLVGSLAAPLLRVMKHATNDVAMAAVRVGGRPALVIVADDLGDTLLATKRMEDLARAAGEALERILRSRK